MTPDPYTATPDGRILAPGGRALTPAEAAAELSRRERGEVAALLKLGHLMNAATRLEDAGALACTYVDEDPAVCPGVVRVGGPCPWCGLRAALAAAMEGAPRVGEAAALLRLARCVAEERAAARAMDRAVTDAEYVAAMGRYTRATGATGVALDACMALLGKEGEI